jgi:hypothetical protein
MLPFISKVCLNHIQHKKILIILFIFLTITSYANEAIMKITLESRSNTGEKQYTVIYQGTPSPTLHNLIKKAKPIRFGNIEKAAISEGEYIIEFLDENKRYSVQNNYWIYDEYRETFLRCSILSNLRGYLLDYLFKKGIAL